MNKSSHLITITILFSLICLYGCRRKMSLVYDIHITIVNNNDTLYSFIGKKSHTNYSKKLLVFLQGSEQHNANNYFGFGAEASRFGYDILLINKFAYYDNERYWQTNSIYRRIDDVCAVITDVSQNVYKGSLESIMVLGGSEGGSIAPVVTKKIPAVKHLIIMGSNCLPQLRDFEYLISKGFKGQLNYFRSSGVMNVEELRNKAEEIRNSSDTLRGWMGYSYKYWQSALFDTLSYSAISSLDIPVLLIAGDKDESSSIEGVKQLRDRLSGKSNIRFEIVPDVDHRFRNMQSQNMMPMVFKDVILPWCQTNNAL